MYFIVYFVLPKDFISFVQEGTSDHQGGYDGELSSAEQHQNAMFGVLTGSGQATTPPLLTTTPPLLATTPPTSALTSVTTPTTVITSTSDQEPVSLVVEKQESKTQRWLNKLKEYRSTRQPPLPIH